LACGTKMKNTPLELPADFLALVDETKVETIPLERLIVKTLAWRRGKRKKVENTPLKQPVVKILAW
jgi:hypothetical protein